MINYRCKSVGDMQAWRTGLLNSSFSTWNMYLCIWCKIWLIFVIMKQSYKHEGYYCKNSPTPILHKAYSFFYSGNKSMENSTRNNKFFPRTEYFFVGTRGRLIISTEHGSTNSSSGGWGVRSVLPPPHMSSCIPPPSIFFPDPPRNR